MLFCRFMPAERFADLTWTEVEALDPSRVVPILPIGATEAHGPHLPLSTDTIIADAMARSAARRLAGRGWVPLVLPGLDYSPAPFASGFAGTISVRAETVTALLLDIARSLSARRVRVLALANAHLDPAHLRALRAAVREARTEDLLQVVFPDLTRRRWAGRLTDEFRSGACHAGSYEGSVVLAAQPSLVRHQVLASLPPNPVSLSQAIREGKTRFEEAGGPQAYFGDPSSASTEEGRRTIEVLGEILEEAVVAELGEEP